MKIGIVNQEIIMQTQNAKKLVSFFLPHLMVAGDYALNIQGRISSLPNKSAKNAASPALTDADLSIQNYFETLVIAAFPKAGFIGEEDNNSVNKKYFLSGQELTIVLDPINGTLRYQNGDVFEIILTVLDGRHNIFASMLYVPKIETCYVGIADKGAFVISKTHTKLDAPLRAPFPSQNKVLTLRANMLEKQLKENFLVFDEHRDYIPRKYTHAPYEIFTGELRAFVISQPHCEDSLPLAFIASLAGFIVTDFNGCAIDFSFESLQDKKSSLVIANTPETHDLIMHRKNIDLKVKS